MENIKISVLVPICNVEKYLDKCLSSIISQSLKELEIICINDGSKDGSLEIIKKHATADSRIVVIDKPNSGYGDSMNKGLALAKGEYIGIVESDDFIESNMFEKLYSLAKKYDADLVKSNFNMYWDSPEHKVYFNNLAINNIIDNTELARDHIFWGMPAIWSAIYKKSWLLDKKIKFLPTPGASYQDTSFNFKTVVSAKTIVITSKAYLNYRQDNANSSVKNTSMEKVYLLHKEWEEVEKYLKTNHYMSTFSKYYNTLKFNGYAWNYMRISNIDRKSYFNEIKNLVEENTNSIDVKHIPKYCRYGGFWALKHNCKILLDLTLWLRKKVKNEN